MSLLSVKVLQIALLSAPPTTKSSRGAKGSLTDCLRLRRDRSERSINSVPPQITQRCGSRLTICSGARTGSPKFEKTGLTRIRALGARQCNCSQSTSLLTMERSESRAMARVIRICVERSQKALCHHDPEAYNS